MKKVLYLSADFGQGHNSTVRAVQEALDAAFPKKFEHLVLDTPTIIGPTIDKAIEFLYKGSVARAKLSYKAFFELTDKYTPSDADKRAYKILKPSLKGIENLKPDLVVSCYPLLTYTVSRYFHEKGVKVPFVAIVTDTGDVHNFWLSKQVDYYLVPTIDTGYFLGLRGVEEAKIKTLGFPLRQMFYKKYDKKILHEKYDIPKNKKVVCYFAGTYGLGKVVNKVKALDKFLNDICLIVICGKNQKLVEKLKQLHFKNERKILGYVDEIAEIYDISDLVVTKAGGISTMEVINAKKPSIIAEVTPGQEEPNAQFVETQGFGYVEEKPTSLAKRAKYILETTDKDRLQDNLNKYHLNDKSDRKIAKFLASLVNIS